MKFKAKRIFLRPVGGVNRDINVTPLVDVVLVLLIIFMVLTPLLEKNIALRTPATETVEQVAEVPPDQIIVYVDGKGALRLNTASVSREDFVEKLKRLLDFRSTGDRTVYVVAADGLAYGTFVSVLDAAREAGARTLGFATDPPDPALFGASAL